MSRFLSWLGSLASELKRRRVYHVASVYAVAGWVVLQVTKLLVDALFLPPASLTAGLVLVLLGFPIAMVLTWLYDLTPDGVERTAGAGSDAPPPGVRRGVLAVLMGATLLATAAAGWATWRVWLGPAAAVGSTADEGEDGRRLDPSRLAVLYLDNLSGRPELDAVADGLTEDLTHELARAEGLDVVSRRAVRPYRRLDVPLDSIARELQVGSLVEGSVDLSGDSLRVTMQLVDGSTASHLASERVSAPTGDALALRDELVSRVARLLRRELGRSVEVKRSRAATDDPAAWRLYHEARRRVAFADTLRLGDDIEAARDMFRTADSLLARAEELDDDWPGPALTRGWIAYGRTRLEAGGSVSDFDPEILAEGIAHAERVLEDRPGHPAALELRGTLRYHLSRAASGTASSELTSSAEEDLRTAVAAESGRAVAWMWLAQLLRSEGRFGEARYAWDRSREADPFLIYETEHLWLSTQLALDLEDLEAAWKLATRGRRLFPGNPAFDAALLTLAAGTGAPELTVDSAWALERLVADHQPGGRWPDGEMLVAAVLVRAGLSDSAAAVRRRARRATAPDQASTHYMEANVALQMGDTSEALSHLEACLGTPPCRPRYLASDWWWRPLRTHPRFLSLLGEER